MKISIISYDLGNNCLGRAYLLGKVLRRKYDVEIHGFSFTNTEDPIWKPCDTGEFNYHSIAEKKFPSFFKSMAEMAKRLDGDVIYASKLRLPSYGVSLLKKVFGNKPVVLDIDDLETSWYQHLKGSRRWRTIWDPTGPYPTQWMEHCVRFADEVTTVSTQLQHKYGRGIIIPHGKDTESFDPDKYDRIPMRKELGIKDFKTIMFLGTARPHKGLDDIVKALNLLDRDDIRLMVIGAGADNKYDQSLKELGGEKIILRDGIPFNAIPEYLNAADLVVLPQKNDMQSYGQIPAKLFDAMAMAKPIIATNVADLALILEGCGLIVEPGDIASLAEKINWVFSHPMEAAAMGRDARKKCIDEYSWDIMEKKLVTIFEKYE
ncbi:MAG: glycosyltransferase family 4 protein [Desulfuromusa sp.]|nr:glycosyltransferase family 4 protein [Desulfuromusa sp.]